MKTMVALLLAISLAGCASAPPVAWGDEDAENRYADGTVKYADGDPDGLALMTPASCDPKSWQEFNVEAVRMVSERGRCLVADTKEGCLAKLREINNTAGANCQAQKPTYVPVPGPELMYGFMNNMFPQKMAPRTCMYGNRMSYCR